MKIDMHVHSVYSDGTDTPEKIIEANNIEEKEQNL